MLLLLIAVQQQGETDDAPKESNQTRAEIDGVPTSPVQQHESTDLLVQRNVQAFAEDDFAAGCSVQQREVTDVVARTSAVGRSQALLPCSTPSRDSRAAR